MLYGMIQDDRIPIELVDARRDYTHIEDVCSAITLLIRNCRNGNPDRPYEIGYCNPITTEAFLKLNNVNTDNISFNEPSHDYSESHFTCASPSALYKLGWTPQHISR